MKRLFKGEAYRPYRLRYKSFLIILLPTSYKKNLSLCPLCSLWLKILPPSCHSC
ncbi:MAG: hypothetical protein LBJ00_03995 [Planctomycetaceae bacterium]|nr:hypothetical protein [Planctomycetaceae bacterium]